MLANVTPFSLLKKAILWLMWERSLQKKCPDVQRQPKLPTRSSV